MTSSAPKASARFAGPASQLDAGVKEALDCFRSRSQKLWQWNAVIDYANEASNGVLLLEQLAAAHGAAAVTPHVQKAIDITFRVLMRADDSNGAIQSVIDELLDLHAMLCEQEPPTPAKLVNWMMKFEFGEAGSYWHVDPVRYADALGETGVTRLLRELAKQEAQLTTAFDQRPDTKFSHDDEWGTRNRLLSMYQRLAVLDGDEAAILRTHLPDAPQAYQAVEAASALVEAGHFDRALAIAHLGMRLEGADHQQRKSAEVWVDLVRQHLPEQLYQATLEVFDLWPTQTHASALRRAAGDLWPEMREEVLVAMRQDPKQLIEFVVSDDPQRAWDETLLAEKATPPRELFGRTLHTISLGLWEIVAEAYAPIDPIAALDKLAEMMDRRLEIANSANYRNDVAQMVNMKMIGRRTAQEPYAVNLLEGIRAKYARRPALMKRMDRARLNV